MKPRTHACADCPAMVTATATRCRVCAARFVGRREDASRARDAAIRAKFTDEAHLARMQASARRASAARVERALGWCPPEHRAEYLRMTRTMFASRGIRMPAAKCRALMIARIKADRANLSPFERQERALANGARIVANAPVYRGVR